MVKQRVTIEVDVPDGYEPTGENIKITAAMVLATQQQFVGVGIILRKTFEWPTWLKAKAIAKDGDGRWFAYGEVPHKRDDNRWGVAAVACCLNQILFDIDLPDVPWEQSLILNPNTEGEQ